jgi:hypothetical protein
MNKSVSPQRPRRKPSQPEPVVAPESFKHLVLQIVSDSTRTKNLTRLIATCGTVVFGVLCALAVLLYLVTQGGLVTWVTAGGTCLGTGGLAVAQWVRLKRRK